jgi:hypothetical protein
LVGNIKEWHSQKTIGELKARLSDRVLSPTEQAELSDVLKSFSGIEIAVIRFGDTPEIGNISNDVISSLEKAGWSVHAGVTGGGGAVAKGIIVAVRPDSDPKTRGAAIALAKTLLKMGIDAQLWDFDEMLHPGILYNVSITFKEPIQLFISAKT